MPKYIPTSQRWQCVCLIVGLLAALAPKLCAQDEGVAISARAPITTTSPGPANFSLLLRDEEDWTALRDKGVQRSGLETFKYIPLKDQGPEAFISSGGEIREWFEHFDNEGWGTIPSGDNYLLQRYMVHSDVHFSSHVRMFFQLKSGLQHFRKVGPRPFDEDHLDFNQGYLDLNFGVKQNTPAQAVAASKIGTPSGNDLHPMAILRLGRQELNFGSGRLVSVGEGVNVRFGFDAARVILQPANWRIDIFYAKPDAYKSGVFDDAPATGQTLSGVYATTPLAVGSKASIDLYYLSSDFKSATFAQGTGRDHRQTFGTRLFNSNPSSAWNYDVEGTLQFGTFKPASPAPSGEIRAWGISPFVGYGFLHTPLTPHISVNGGITSGDKNPADGNLQSFSGLFARGDYFGKSKQIGPVNVASLQPELSLSLPHHLTAIVDANLLWRQSTHDGIYAATGMPVRTAGGSGGSTARYVGAAPEIELIWQRSKHVSMDFTYQRYLVGKYLRQQPPGGSDLNFIATYVTVKF